VFEANLEEEDPVEFLVEDLGKEVDSMEGHFVRYFEPSLDS